MNELNSLLATLNGAAPDSLELENLYRMSIAPQEAAPLIQPSMIPSGRTIPSDQSLTQLLAGVQAQVDGLMKTDNTFRKEMGYSPIESSAEDPLRADKNGWNLPKTGVVNTTGALQRINARAEAEGSGVSAVMGANGQLTLTNLSPQTGALLTGKKLGTSAGTGQSPIELSGLINQLREVGTTAEGSVIMDSLRTTVAAENARLSKEALSFASNKLGIPSLEQQLILSEANDKASYGWFPGIGDSPGTLQIRSTIQGLRTAAGSEADKFLATSMSSGLLKTQMAAAEQEMKRLATREDRRSNLEDNISLNRANYNLRKEEEDLANIQATSPEDLANLKILVPQIDLAEPKSMAIAIKNASRDKGRVEALKAASVGGDQLIQLAVMGNADANLLLLNKEKILDPTMDEDIFKVKMKRIQNLASSDDFVNKSVRARFNGSVTSKEAKAEIERLNAQKLPGKSAEDKALDTKERFAIALQIERQAATGNFLANANKWQVEDPLFKQAVTTSLQQRGKADFETVLTNYLGNSTGAEGLQKLQTLTATVDQAFGSQKASVFGMPDVSTAKRMISQRGKQVNIGSVLGNSTGKPSPFAGGRGDTLDIGLGDFFDSFQIKIDPVTGLPYPK